MYFFRKISLKCTFFDFLSAFLKIKTGKSVKEETCDGRSFNKKKHVMKNPSVKRSREDSNFPYNREAFLQR